VLQFSFGCVAEAAKQLGGQFFWALGQNMGREPKRIAKESEGFIRGQIEKLEICQEGVHAGGAQLGRQPTVVEQQGTKCRCSFSIADVPCDLLEEVPVGRDGMKSLVR
jgi:hypothetical protein